MKTPETFLFIGGPNDGQRIKIPASQLTVEVLAPVEGMGYQRVTYRSELLGFQERDDRTGAMRMFRELVFIPEGWTYTQIMEHMLANYGTPMGQKPSKNSESLSGTQS